MTGSAFFDTNVLVYAEDQDEPDKRAIALKLLAEHIAAENLNDKQDYGGVRVENPFKSARR